MATIEKFEDIEAWQDARLLVREVYMCVRSSDISGDFGLRDQIQRAAVSVMANIAEGFERQSPKEFMQFLKIARGSCAEVQSHTYAALDIGLISQDQFNTLQALTSKTGKRISGFQRYLRSRNST